MRGNPLVELVAILVMLASVLVGGGYWLINKQVQEHEEKEKWIEEFRKEAKIKQEKANLSFEKAVKATQ
nr:MAG TPA: Protein of unknown function (DUF3042) [Caudoviricetes sp.]